MPAGFAIEPATASGDSPQASSKDPKCAAFVARSNLKAAPGSTAHEEIAFSGGQSGPFIREYMDGFASAATAAASLAEYRAAIASCAQVILTVPGGGKSTVTVKTVNPPAYGDTPIATRMTARGGPLNGLEITEVRAAVGNTIVTLNFVATAPADIDGGAQLAVEKARASLDVKTTATS
jgi:hypothetical protein